MLTEHEENVVREKLPKKKTTRPKTKTGVVRPWLVDVSLDELK